MSDDGMAVQGNGSTEPRLTDAIPEEELAMWRELLSQLDDIRAELERFEKSRPPPDMARGRRIVDAYVRMLQEAGDLPSDWWPAPAKVG